MKDRFNRELYPIVCAECGKNDHVPFQHYYKEKKKREVDYILES